MLLDVEDLQAYLQEAFSRYTSTLDSPFDFVQASFRNSPIPPDLGANILKLALNVMDILQVRRNSITGGRRIFEELAFVVASCIMLDIARHKTKGTSLHTPARFVPITKLTRDRGRVEDIRELHEPT